MLHYLFTNDLRISNLETFLVNAAKCFKYNSVPSADEDKNANNNMNTLGFYFNLTANSNCTKICLNGNTRKVILNFIKKFQFPNPRTEDSLNYCLNDGITLAPLRVIMQVLYMMSIISPEDAYLSKREIIKFIFFNEKVAKSVHPDIGELINEIIAKRTPDDKLDVPDDAELEEQGYYWKQCKRQVREMIEILLRSGYIAEEGDRIFISYDDLSCDNKSDIFDIINYNGFWSPDSNKPLSANKQSYIEYFDIVLEDEQSNTLVYDTSLKSDKSLNRIIFGAPGTGKSFLLNQERKDLLGENYNSDYERVTFHPDYSYANFVGTYKPVMINDTFSSFSDSDTLYITSVLTDEDKTAQEKYDLLYDTFNQGDSLTRLPILLGIYTDDDFKTKKKNGELTADNNSAEKNHGKSIRKFVKTLSTHDTCSEIAYEYVPGPFMRVYVKALRSARSSNPKPYLLIIEEINRANVAAVFGDVFQLLDRSDNGVSEYPIQASEDIKKYLARELGGNPNDYSTLKIPNNMFIWATMNSADQGVFPMDTAFKRRWDFTYIGIDDNEQGIRGKYVLLGGDSKQKVEWNKLRKAINSFLADKGINEDKQLGPYFISRKIVIPSIGNEIDRTLFCEVFKNKVLMYLFEDAARQKRLMLFDGCMSADKNRYSSICKEFDEKGIKIFHNDIVNIVTKNSATKDAKE